jgi:short-subunit dehydrogenase
VHIDGSVIVVTGASSGIGRATALELAGRGARVVLLARRADALAEVAARCGTDRSLVVPTDVTDPDAVENAAAAAVERFGRIDGWVNCAAVTLFGPLLELPLADVRRVLDVNVMGCVHGTRTALARFAAQDAGVLVNVSSMLGRIAQPYGSAYTMSKFAIRGLSVAVREELRLAGVRGVSVSTVLPAAVDTPIYAAAGNRTGRIPTPPPPVYSAERVARTIVGQLRRPRREVVAGGPLARAFVLQHVVTPRLAERMLAIDVAAAFRRDPAGTVPPTSGALYSPGAAPATVDGGFDGRRRERRRGLVALAAAGAAALVGGAAVTRRRAGRPFVARTRSARP